MSAFLNELKTYPKKTQFKNFKQKLFFASIKDCCPNSNLKINKFKACKNYKLV